MKILTDLMPHQKTAVEKLGKLKVAALYMEQGTGKTRTMLSLIQPRLDKGKVDVVLWLCPCSVKKSLRDDLAYHCGEVPSEIIIRGIESLSSSDKLYMQLLKLVEQHRVYLVVDESNLIKNPGAIRTERVTAISQRCQYKAILNGTPISRNEADLFAQWFVLDWRILGYKSYYSFAANHLEYWEIRRPDGSKYVDKSRVRNVLNLDYLTSKIAPYTYQVKKDECLKLPDKKYRRVVAHMDNAQAEEYARVRWLYLMSVDEMKDDTIYKFFTALQHVASGRRVLSDPHEKMRTEPMYQNPKDNPRMQALVAEALEGNEKAIIFCKYQSEVTDALLLLPGSVEFTGRLSQEKRQESLSKFRQDARFLVANKNCGAYGLNLQFCHKIIFYNNDFNLATRFQAEDRVHRIGQSHVVEIVDIVTDNTIDGFIADCLTRKKRLAEAFKRQIKEEQDAANIQHGKCAGRSEEAHS